MAKLVLADLASLSNESSAIATINENMALIAAAMENTLSRDGTAPNEMGSELDANDTKIINVADPVADPDAVNLRTLRRATVLGLAGMFFKGYLDFGDPEPTDPMTGDVWAISTEGSGLYLGVSVTLGDFIVYDGSQWLRWESQGFTDGNFNTSYGREALTSITSESGVNGASNTAYGYEALANSAGLESNTAIGAHALKDSNGPQNTAVGDSALIACADGAQNTAIGHRALHSVVGENGNTGVGHNAGYADNSGSKNTYLGAEADVESNEVNATESTAVGYNAKITKENQMVLGNSNQIEILAQGEMKIAQVSTGLSIAEGLNGRQGVVNLVAGVATVETTSIGSESRVFLQRQADDGTVGASYSITRNPGSDFTITAMNGSGVAQPLDTSLIAYFITENSIEGV